MHEWSRRVDRRLSWHPRDFVRMHGQAERAFSGGCAAPPGWPPSARVGWPPRAPATAGGRRSPPLRRLRRRRRQRWPPGLVCERSFGREAGKTLDASPQRLSRVGGGAGARGRWLEQPEPATVEGWEARGGSLAFFPSATHLAPRRLITPSISRRTCTAHIPASAIRTAQAGSGRRRALEHRQHGARPAVVPARHAAALHAPPQLRQQAGAVAGGAAAFEASEDIQQLLRLQTQGGRQIEDGRRQLISRAARATCQPAGRPALCVPHACKQRPLTSWSGVAKSRPLAWWLTSSPMQL